MGRVAWRGIFRVTSPEQAPKVHLNDFCLFNAVWSYFKSQFNKCLSCSQSRVITFPALQNKPLLVHSPKVFLSGVGEESFLAPVGVSLDLNFWIILCGCFSRWESGSDAKRQQETTEIARNGWENSVWTMDKHAALWKPPVHPCAMALSTRIGRCSGQVSSKRGSKRECSEPKLATKSTTLVWNLGVCGWFPWGGGTESAVRARVGPPGNRIVGSETFWRNIWTTGSREREDLCKLPQMDAWPASQGEWGE